MFNKETNQNLGSDTTVHDRKSVGTILKKRTKVVGSTITVIAKKIPNTLVYLFRLLTINFLQPFTSATYKI